MLSNIKNAMTVFVIMILVIAALFVVPALLFLAGVFIFALFIYGILFAKPEEEPTDPFKR